MKPRLSISLCVCLSLLACGGGQKPDQARRASFEPDVDHPFFPLTPDTTRIYEGVHEGRHLREEVSTLGQTRVIAGITCTAVRQEVYIDDVPTEITTEWFAQDPEGAVWKFGEETFELNGTELAPTPDSWLAGVDGGQPWIAFPSGPRAGDLLVGYGPGGREIIEVLSVTRTVKVAAGVFHDCMEVLESSDEPDDADIVLYAPGVGRVSERSPSGQIDLESVGGR